MDERRGSFAALETASALAPRIRAAQDVIDAEARLPPDLVRELAGRGLFRLLLPKALGGAEVSLPEYIRCIEVVAEADGSAGWCVGQGGVFANVADAMRPETAREIWADDPGAVVATGTPFGCTARPTADGYALSGRWRFASGCAHATWFAAMSPIVDAAGAPTGFGMFLAPRADIPIVEAWNVRGLRGTGSHEYSLDGLAVPASRSLMGAVFREHSGAATGLPSHLLFASAFGAVGLGVARRAIDELYGIVAGKTPAFTNRRLLDDDLVHIGIADAEAIWGAGRAFLLEAAEAAAYAHGQGDRPSDALRTHLRLAATNAIRQSGKAVGKAYELAGSSAIFDDHPIQRCFQDINAVTQQLQGRRAHFRTVGRVLLGLDPDESVL